MSIQIVEKEEVSVGSPQPGDLPPLESGDRLSRVEFEQRYQAHPEVKKAELIEGVVYMPSPTHLAQHGEPHGYLVAWLGVYSASTVGTRLANNASVRLDYENELQPDAFLRLLPAFGGAAQATADDYLEGPPELIN